MSCPPRYATRRRPERETFGHELDNVAEKLGQPLMPWQRFVADVGCEIDPASGLPAYREIRVTIPRQSGKTTLYLSWQIHRCVARRWSHPQRSAFTAQTGKDARDKWIDELFPLIRNSRLKSLVAASGRGGLAINEGMGNESIRFRTGSVIRLLSSSATSGHSKTLDQAVIDELWHDVDDRREQGLRPAMLTKRDAQLLVCSTAGTEQSIILNRKIEAGRQAVLKESGFGVAYFEWSAPDDWDPDDWDSYFGFSPALCPDPPCRCDPEGRWHHTVTLRELQAERDSGMDLAEFKRAYGNVTAGQSDLRWQAFGQSEWEDAEAKFDPPESLALCVVLSADRQWASICAAGSIGDGRYGVAILDRREGTGWVVDRLFDRAKSLNPVAVLINKSGPEGSLWAEVSERNLGASALVGDTVVELVPVGPQNVAAADEALWDAICGPPSADPDTGEVVDPRVVRHLGQRELTDAAAGAVWKVSVNGSRQFDPGVGEPSTLKGCALALQGFREREPSMEDPWIWSGLD